MSTRKILVVDDSKSARYALRLLLQKHNYTVDTAESAESGLEKVKTDPPDAIFMDHLMPGMNGFEALEALKADATTAHIPVVMCTSNDDEPYRLQARQKGAMDTLPKPASQDRLKAILQAIDEAAQQPVPAAEPAPTAAEEAPAAAAPAFAMEEVENLVKAQSRTLFDTEIKPLLADTLDTRLQETLDGRMDQLRGQLLEQFTAQAGERMAEEIGTAVAGLREELKGAEGGGDLEEKLDTKLAQLEETLVKKETEHAQAVAYKLSHEILPGLIQSDMEEQEKRIIDRLDLRFDELADRLAEEIPKSAGMMRHIAETAEAAAEHKAAEIAATQAHQVAEATAGDRAAEVADTLTHAAHAALKRMYLLAGGAAAAGILAAVVVYFLAG